jgi:tetratricopeptide (TPR) repeat protein
MLNNHNMPQGGRSMSRTLNLIDMLLNSGRHLHGIGRNQEALDVLTRLADFRKLPTHVVEEIQTLLADLYMQRENYPKARRHLTSLLALRPLKAQYHYLMGLAIEEDDDADLKRAEQYYALAAELEPDNAAYWVDYGTYLLRIGNRKMGLKAIRKAYALDTHDPDIVAQVAEALRNEDRFEEAGTKLRAAFFSNHGDERFHRLWQQHQFQMIREEQQQKQRVALGRKKGPVILPFAPAASTGKYADLGEKTIRIDQAEPLPGPKSPMPVPFRRPPKG